MRLIFIRHAEPYYEKRSLTEKGFREARILADRVKTWDVDRFYASSLPRAILTLEPALEALGREDELRKVDWLREFGYYVPDPMTGKNKVPWDFMPRYWTHEDTFYEPYTWYEHPLIQSNPDYEVAVHAMREGLDDVLADYGLERFGRYYRRPSTLAAATSETEQETAPRTFSEEGGPTLVFSGHLGANMEAIGYLLGISPLILQQTIFLAPTSVTILNAEEREPGHVMFRAQCIGDTSHLTAANEPISQRGSFAPVLNG